jgi:protein CpxP
MRNLVVIALAILTMSATAQDRKQDRKGQQHRNEIVKDMTPQEVANLKTKKLTLKLDLTDKQQRQVESILLEQAVDRQKKREAHQNKEEKEKPSKEEFLKMQNERLDNQIEMKRKMKDILTEEQYAKFEKMKPRMQHRKGKRATKK